MARKKVISLYGEILLLGPTENCSLFIQKRYKISKEHYQNFNWEFDPSVPLSGNPSRSY